MKIIRSNWAEKGEEDPVRFFPKKHQYFSNCNMIGIRLQKFGPQACLPRIFYLPLRYRYGNCLLSYAALKWALTLTR